MAYNTVAILKDVDQKAIPQYYNATTGLYEVLLGANGASRHTLYGADGNPVSTTGNKLAVRASEIEAQLTAIQGYIDGLEASLGTATADPAANTVLARLKTLATLIGEVQAAPTANTLLARIKSIEDKLTSGIPLSGSTAVNQGTPLTMTGAALQLSNVACRELLIQADPANTNYVYIGNANTVSASVYLVKLAASGWIRLRVNNANLLYAFGTAGNKISYGGEA